MNKSLQNISFEDLTAKVKADIKNSLLEEQNGVCAYCMRQIEYNKMRVEHWLPQSQAVNSTLDYSNMLGVCNGEIGSDYCCDNFRGKVGYGNNGNVKFNPAEPTHYSLLKIRYKPMGEICSDDKDFDKQLSKALNLNNEYMKLCRAAVYTTVCENLNKVNPKKAVTKKQCQKILANWKRLNKKGQLPEYCGVAFYVLEKRMTRCGK